MFVILVLQILGWPMKFIKMQGCGNDYVYVDCFKEKVDNPELLAVDISNRHFGVGSDGLVLIMPSDCADFRMRMFNNDGSEAQMCGNATRCIGKYVYENGLTKSKHIRLETLGGIKTLDLSVEENQVELVKVDMGEPVLMAQSIPIVTGNERFIDEPIHVKGQDLFFTGVSMGNPHAITFVTNVDDFQVKDYGEIIESHKIFPDKVNVEFVEVINTEVLKMRVWERGSGETLACGTGACATLVAGVLNGKCNRQVIIKLLGGDLIVEWEESSNHVYMTGPAEIVFSGDWKK